MAMSREESFNLLDRWLRNNMDDEDYAEYFHALCAATDAPQVSAFKERAEIIATIQGAIHNLTLPECSPSKLEYVKAGARIVVAAVNKALDATRKLEDNEGLSLAQLEAGVRTGSAQTPNPEGQS